MKEKDFRFSADKNAWLIKERGISFEEIVAAMDNGYLLDVIDHPNQSKYDHQQMYVVHAQNYVYLVPFVETSDTEVFLKTIFPSRKATKLYKEEMHHACQKH